MVKIIHHGAVTGVIGSCHQLFDHQDNSILIDCGLFQGDELNSKAEHLLSIYFPLYGLKP